MIKLLIADDEPKIRRGLKNSFDWADLGIEVVGEAEDGEVALQMAKSLLPDIMFIDINMPFLNGLELIEKLKEVIPECIIIIITGYDEFDYAKQAVRLGVFDYILKPVDQLELKKTIEEAITHLTQLKERNQFVDWAKEHFKNNRQEMIKAFMREWTKGDFSPSYIQEQLELFDIQFSDDMVLFLVKILDLVIDDPSQFAFEPPILSFSIQNIMEEILQEYQPTIVFESQEGFVAAMAPIREKGKWLEFELQFRLLISKYLRREVEVLTEKIGANIENMPKTYQHLFKMMELKTGYKPIVTLAKNYIDRYYYKQELSLQNLADELRLSPTHLSRLIHQELGCTFKEYLNKIRIEKAVQFMNDPTIKIYTVAEKVGYSTQHYFSAAFKKVTGVSPNIYKNRKEENIDI